MLILIGEGMKPSKKSCNKNASPPTTLFLFIFFFFFFHFAAGFGGSFCEVNLNDCESKPCLNGGICVDGNDLYQCLCSQGKLQ